MKFDNDLQRWSQGEFLLKPDSDYCAMWNRRYGDSEFDHFNWKGKMQYWYLPSCLYYSTSLGEFMKFAKPPFYRKEEEYEYKYFKECIEHYTTTTIYDGSYLHVDEKGLAICICNYLFAKQCRHLFYKRGHSTPHKDDWLRIKIKKLFLKEGSIEKKKMIKEIISISIIYACMINGEDSQKFVGKFIKDLLTYEEQILFLGKLCLYVELFDWNVEGIICTVLGGDNAKHRKVIADTKRHLIEIGRSDIVKKR